MSIDRQVKRFFPLVLCSALAGAAYFQASGIGQLLASSVAHSGGDAPPAPGAPPAIGVGVSDRKSGTAILARNPFDSVTGPLDGSAPPPVEEGDEEPSEDPSPAEVSDGDPQCSFGTVILISASEDPAWSFASIKDRGGQSQLARMGDEVSGHQVQAMSWDTVWLEDGGRRCQMRLGEDGPTSAAPKPKRTARKRPRTRGRGRQLAPEMASKITKVSDTEFNIERSLVDELLQDQAQLMRSARIIPAKEGDDVVGIKLFGVRSGTLLDHLGIKNGDRLESINGFQMSDPQKALEAYGRLRSANKLSVKINRGGKPQTIDFNIQ